jgi:WD40 repeat protein
MLQNSLLVVASLTLFQAAARDDALAEAPQPAKHDPDRLALQPIRILGTKSLRTEGALHALAYVNGDQCVAGAWDGFVEVWQDDVKVVRAAGPSRTRAIPAPDGRTAVRIVEGKRILLWDLKTGDQIRQFRGEAGPITGAVWSPCGRLLAVGVGPAVFLWDVATGNVQRVLTGDSLRHPVLCFSNDGVKLAGGDREAAQIWDVSSGARLTRLAGGFSGAESSVAFSADGKTLVGCCYQAMGDGLGRVGVRQWDASTGATIRDLEYGSFNSVAVAPDGNDAYGGAHGSIYRWHLPTGKQVHRWLAHAGEVRRLAMTRDGKTLCSAGDDLQLRRWNLRSDHDPAPGHTQAVLAVAFSPEGNMIASTGDDRRLRVWDAASGKQVRRSLEVVSDWGAGRVAFAPDGKTIVTAERHAGGSMLRLWDVGAGTQIAEAPTRIEGSLVFVSGGQWLVAANADGQVCRWHPRALVSADAIDDLSTSVAGTSFSADGRLLAWHGPEGGYGVRDVQARTDLLRRRERASMIALSGDGGIVAAEVNGALVVWDLPNGKQTQWTPEAPIAEGGLALSFDGRLLAAAMEQGVVVWETASGKEVAAFPSDQGGARCVAFAPDGRTLVAGVEEGVQFIWDLTGRNREARTSTAGRSKTELLRLVARLRGGDAALAQTAIWALAASGDEAIALVETLLFAPVDNAKTRQSIRDLSSDRFTIRDQAMKQLSALADEAQLSLAHALAQTADLETRRRIELLLRRLEQGEVATRAVQNQRALAVLEHLNNTNARAVLERLARTAPQDSCTPAVQAILRRWPNRE